MAKEARNKRRGGPICDDPKVFDDFAIEEPITASELDAVEAFFGPLLRELIGGRSPSNVRTQGGFDSEAPQSSAI